MNAINPHFRPASLPVTPPRPDAGRRQPVYAKLPLAPITGSPVPHLTSLYHDDDPGPYGDRGYPGNCGGNVIRDLLLFFQPKSVFDPFLGSGTAREVCRSLGIEYAGIDIRYGQDACSAGSYPRGREFDFVWAHPPYHRMKRYTDDVRDLSNQPTLAAFLERYGRFLRHCAGVLAEGGKLAVLMGDHQDLREGYLPLNYHTKRLAFEAGLRQHCTDVVRFSHGASSGRKTYRKAFIPGLHDIVHLFEKPVAAPSPEPRTGSLDA
ncbi:MAG: hypothetical protein ACRC33_25230 [Gemmataceae bacterium]